MTVPLAVRSDGPAGAPVLVLLNSMATTTEMWTPCLGPLVEQFRVVRIDTRGHGGSPPSPPGTRLHLADLGRDVLAALDELGLQRVKLAGLSLGGMTAMWLAAHHPERVDRLALLGTTAVQASPDAYRRRAATARAEGMTAVADTALELWLTPGIRERDPAVRAELRAMLTGIDAESYAQCCEVVADLDLRADLARIAAPTLVVAGADDTATPPQQGKAIADAVVGARFEIVGPAAHIATYEAPGRIGQLLLEHFRAGATLSTGFARRRELLGDRRVDRAIEATTPITAPFQEFLTRYAWGDVWTRPGLADRDRSITTLAVLVALGAEHEIPMHVRAALRAGLTAEEIGEVVLHTALYAGLPRANRAFALLQQVLAEPDET